MNADSQQEVLRKPAGQVGNGYRLFLRDTLVQFTGTVLAALFLYAWALGLGYLQRPENFVASYLLAAFAPAALGLVIGIIAARGATRITRTILETRGWWETPIAILNTVLAFAIAIPFLLMGYWLGRLLLQSLV